MFNMFRYGNLVKKSFKCKSDLQKVLCSRLSSLSGPQIPPFDYEPRTYRGILADEILQKRKKFLGPSLFYYYQKPINIVEGKMQYLFDENGKRYLDAFAGIVTVSCGHCHPDIVNAVVEQTKILQHTTTIYLHHAIAEYAEALAAKMPGNLKVDVYGDTDDGMIVVENMWISTLSLVREMKDEVPNSVEDCMETME